MFYPNFSRRTLALILSCLIITLGGVGLLFLIYIFNETTSLLSGPLEKISHSNQPYKQSVIKSDEHTFDKRIKNQRTQEIKGNINRANLFKNRSTYNGVGYNNKIQPLTLSTKEAKTTEVNLDTIYIDDFDHPTYNRKSKNDIGNIDYFDVILDDHKENTKLNNLNKVPNHSVKYKNIVFETINNKNKKNKKKKKQKDVTNETLTEINTKALLKAIAAKNRSAEDSLNLSDTENAGSGSGDYTDDTELNEIYTKKDYNDNNIGALSQKRKTKKHRQWKHPYHLFENYSKSASSLSRLTTSYTDSNNINGLTNRKGLANLSSYPTISSQFIAQIKTDSFPKETDKKLLPLNSFTRYIELFSNDSYPRSSTFQNNNDSHDHLRISGYGSKVDGQAIYNTLAKQRENDIGENDDSWIETRTRRIMGNVKKSEERSRQLLLCEEAGGGELCRMLFKEHVSD